jgi:two-component system CheB/CheR fusion protein
MNVNQIKTPTYVVCIGASAGGLEALQSLFDAMPPNLGCAYLVAQHLSPDFKSLMDTLLSKHTNMPVNIAEDGCTLEPNKVYLLPAGKIMRVVEMKIYLSDVPPTTRVNFPINELFRSVAEDVKHFGIGIVLSGTGSDGTRGIQALKDAGSLVIVQDPEEAQFDGMPKSAMDSGSVDFVLNAHDIPERLSLYLKHPLNQANKNQFLQHLAESQDVLTQILKLIQKESDIDISAYKETVIARRLEHRLSTNGLVNLTDYLAFIKDNKAEIAQIKQDLLIGVTQFFRDPLVWTKVEDTVIASILAEKTDLPIRVWCSGCSTGEEPYTIAILFKEKMEELGIRRPLKVFASDIDQSAVSFAAAGVYPDSIHSEMPQHILDKYFEPLMDGSYKVRKELRSSVVFATHNLIQDPPFSNMDFVTCRNMLIYFSTETQQKTLALMHFALKIGGYLLLGTAETPGNHSHFFTAIDQKRRLYKKEKDLRIPISSMSMHNNTQDLRAKPFHPSSLPTFISRANSLSESISHPTKTFQLPIGLQGVIEAFVPTTFVINLRHEVQYLYGDGSLYTKQFSPGVVNTQIGNMLQEDVAPIVVSLCHEVERTKKSVSLNQCFVRNDKKLSVRCSYYSPKDSEKDLLLISFYESDPTIQPATDIQYSPDQVDSRRITELDNSLLDYQNKYHEALVELGNTREELQSSNEELMAANEELQSTNEELQSVNEELYTVNSEYHEKIGELSDVNNDLERAIRSSNLAYILLGENLQIRRFTPEAQKIINILDIDIGREIKDLKFKANFDGLFEMIEQANTTHTQLNKVFETEQGSINIKVDPYNVSTSKQGIILIFSFLTEN